MSKFKLWCISNKAAVKKASVVCAIAAVCLVLVLVGVWVFTGPLTGNTRVDWTMQGYLLNADGDIVETLEISVQGRIKDRTGKRDSLWLGFTMPDSFQYPLSAEADREKYNLDKDDHFPYYIGHEDFFEQHTSSFFRAYYAIDTQKKYFICQWENEPGQYLVASTDPNADANEILEHFTEFVRIYSSES